MQHRQAQEQAIFDFNQIFIGREQQLADFRRVLRDWKQLMASRDPEQTFSTDPPSPRHRLQGLIVMLFGRGGFGKSTLLRHYHEIAVHEHTQPHNGKITVCDLIDWENDLDGSKRGIYNPAQGQDVDPSEYYKTLCAQLAARLDKAPKDFRAYQQAAGDVERARSAANKVLEELKRDKEDRYKELRGASIEAVAATISSIAPVSKLIVENEQVKKSTDTLLKLTGEQINHLRQRFRDRLGEKLSDYLEPTRRLGLALGSDLHNFAKNFPLLIFFDTYEQIDAGDALLRMVMGAAGLRVGWVIAGRGNLWSGAGQVERSTELISGYKELVATDRSLSVNFNSEDVGAFTHSNIKEYFDLVCEHFPCNPPLAKVTDEDTQRLWDVTKGIPLAINIAAALYSETADLDTVTEHVEGQKKIIDAMVLRYLLHTRIDKSERAKLYAIAMLRRPEQRPILATAIGLTPEEAAIPTRFNEELSHLHRRYSFVFTEKDAPSLHDEVRHFLRLWLLERRDQPDILATNQRLLEAHEAALNKLESQRNYMTLKDRLQDQQWRGVYLDLAEQRYWLDPVEGLRYLLPLMLLAAVYQRDSNKEAADVGVFFATCLQSPYQEWWTWAAASLVSPSNRNPSSEERNGLEALNRLLNQRRLNPPHPLNQQEELEAALCWRLGEAYRYKDDSKALAWFEKALSTLREEDALKEAIAETCCTLADKLDDEKKYSESIHFSQRAIEIKPDYPWGYNARGIARAHQKAYLLAIEDYTEAIHLDPNYVKAYSNRGTAYYKQQRYDQATADFDAAIRLDPNYVKAYSNRGNAYYKQQQYDQAIADYDAAIRLDPNYASAYHNRAKAHYLLEHYEEAITDYSRVLELNPDVDVYLERGYAYLNLKKVVQAVTDFQKGAEANSGDVNMAWMVVFASMGKERPGVEVAERLEKIAAIDPDNPYSDTCIAVALALREKLKDGLAKLEQVLQEYPESDDDNFWKGMLSAYYYQKRPHIAIEAIEKALANGLPPVLLTPLYWLRKDRPAFFEQYAKPLLERYVV